MFKKAAQTSFIFIFLCLLFIPMLMIDVSDGGSSLTEKRTLAKKPELFDENGQVNVDFTSDFSVWLDDHVGFRETMIRTNAWIQYHLFNRLESNSNMLLGPHGELNYATPEIIKDYQHLNLYSLEYLKQIASSVQLIKDYVESKGAKFYYYQCWDKHSIYPEYFSPYINQYGEKSKTDLIVQALQNYTNIEVISPKQNLLEAKAVCAPYSIWGDPTHWSQRGAYIGYLTLMNAINMKSTQPYKVLQLSDYDISLTDQGDTILGGIHEIEYCENFAIKTPHAVLTREKLTLFSDDYRHNFYTNEAVDNCTRLLVIGDSYFNSYILDDLAESFFETIIIWGDYLESIKEIIDTYTPDIVVIENAERVDRTIRMRQGSQKIQLAG